MQGSAAAADMHSSATLVIVQICTELRNHLFVVGNLESVKAMILAA